MSEDERDEEVSWLESIDVLSLISYLDSLFEIVVNAKVDDISNLVKKKLDEQLKIFGSEGLHDLSKDPLEFEKIIVKLEAEVWNHISVQQQLKIYIEVY